MQFKTLEEQRAEREKVFKNREFFCPHEKMYVRVRVRGKIKKTIPTDCPECAAAEKKQKLEAKEAARAAGKATVDQKRAERSEVKFDKLRQRARTEQVIQEWKSHPLVTVDQEDKREDGLGSDLVMSLDGQTQQPWDEQLIPDNAIVVGDVGSLWYRNPRSVSQHWLTPEMLEAMILRLALRGIRVLSIPNKDAMNARIRTFGNDGTEESPGKKFDAVALWLYLKRKPTVLLSATRPVIRMLLQQRTHNPVPGAPTILSGLLETPAQQVEIDWRIAEACRPRELLHRVELAMVGAPECYYFEIANPRKQLAVYLAVRDPQGNLRPWAADTNFIMHSVLRLDGRHRGQKGVGNSMRACLRNVGQGKTPQDLNKSDQEIRELIRHLQREAHP
jgi:hypothetical protein